MTDCTKLQLIKDLVLPLKIHLWPWDGKVHANHMLNCSSHTFACDDAKGTQRRTLVCNYDDVV